VTSGFKKIVVFTALVLVVSIGYFIYAQSVYPPTPERETFLTEIGEGVGEIGLWLLVFIYFRTALKLILGKGSIARRLLPQYRTPFDASLFKRLMIFLDRTHVYFGIGSVAVIILHILLMGIPLTNLFFPAVIVLIAWQALFGIFISWRYTPKELRKASYLVHAQFFSGIMLGIFAYFGHMLIDN